LTARPFFGARPSTVARAQLADYQNHCVPPDITDAATDWRKIGADAGTLERVNFRRCSILLSLEQFNK
jgi:hypothetical protein